MLLFIPATSGQRLGSYVIGFVMLYGAVVLIYRAAIVVNATAVDNCYIMSYGATLIHFHRAGVVNAATVTRSDAVAEV